MTLLAEQRLAEAVLKAWIASDDRMGGDTWDLWCDAAGLDPDVLAKAAVLARANNPHLPCGHFDIPANLYQRYGRSYCRKCQSERRLDYLTRRDRA